MDAIIVRDVRKHFKKSTIPKHHTTFKTEILKWIRGTRDPVPEASQFIDALRGISLVVPKGSTLGLVGRNGSGKSTLLKLITGILAPSSGTIQVNGRISALLELGAGFHPDFSGRENILINGIILGMSRSEITKRAPEIIEFAELGDFIDEPVRTYSSGMYARLAFAVATHVDPEILIIDEILAVGDAYFVKKSRAKMDQFRASGKTILLVTHDLSTAQTWCDTGAWLDGGLIRAVGDPKDVCNQYRQALALAEKRGASPSSYPPATADGIPPPSFNGAPKPAFGPQASLDKRSGDFRIEIEGVRTLDRGSNATLVVDTEDSLEVCIDFVCKERFDEVDFSVSIVRAGGPQVYGTSTLIESYPLPRPLPPKGTIRLRLDRVGLIPGAYFIDVGAQSRDGAVHDSHKGLHPLEVRSPVKDAGLARPTHRWSLESRP